ncbi:MAG: hypothetical protein F6J87_19965 [Spirulina sp. SIO3F2]|nr:hypothetical protein [Spirulina sp. SIO3F2]
MSEANLPNDPQPNETPASDVSPETKAIVDEKLPQESDEIKQHLMALIDAVKRQTQTQLETAGDVTRDVYVNTMRQAQETLKNSGLVLDDQWNSIESSVSGIESLASKNFDVVFKDFQKWGDRMDRAFNAAWQILTEDHDDNGNGGSGESKAEEKPTEVKID